MSLNPPTQYADDRNLAARQRLWDTQDPHFDLPAWALALVGARAGDRVLDVGCGNGRYLRDLRAAGAAAVGCDLSAGMLRTTGHPALAQADAQSLPFADGTFDAVLAAHMLYHVPDRQAAARQLRRVLRPGGTCVVITNGAQHLRSIRTLVERAVRKATPGWELRNPSTHVFSLENGAEQLAAGFASIERIDADAPPVVVTDPTLVAGYVASAGDHYQADVERPWADIVEEVRADVAAVITAEGAFQVQGVVGAFVCR